MLVDDEVSFGHNGTRGQAEDKMSPRVTKVEVRIGESVGVDKHCRNKG